jgi:hypothetical protein
MTDPEIRWRAVSERDSRFDGAFVFDGHLLQTFVPGAAAPARERELL